MGYYNSHEVIFFGIEKLESRFIKLYVEYDTYRFKLPRFKHGDQLVISIDYLVNGDLVVLDPNKEADPAVKKCQESITNGHFLTIEPFKGRALSRIVDYNWDPAKLFNVKLDHGQFKVEFSLDEFMSKLNRKLVIHDGEVDCYAAYDLGHINPAFGRHSIEQYSCDPMPAWLWARLNDGCFDGEQSGKIAKKIDG